MNTASALGMSQKNFTAPFGVDPNDVWIGNSTGVSCCTGTAPG